jgi:hypothetical protein
MGGNVSVRKIAVFVLVAALSYCWCGTCPGRGIVVVTGIIPAPTPVVAPGWDYTNTGTIYGSKVAGHLDDFVFPYEHTFSPGTVYDPNGYDIIFTDFASPTTTVYDHEIENFDGTTTTLTAWVRIPHLSPGTNFNFYILHGHTGVSTSQENAADVWDDDFTAVYHMHSDITNLQQQLDSTQYTNHLTFYTFDSYDTASATGVVDAGFVNVSATGTNIFLASTCCTNYPLTLEAWCETEGAHAVAKGKVMVALGEATASDNQLFVGFDNANPRMVASCRGDGQAGQTVAWTNNQNDGAWHYGVNLAVSATNHSLYNDGSLVGVNTNDATLDSPNVDQISVSGQMWTTNTYGTRWWSDALDEVRISRIARSAAYVETTWNSISDPSTFFTNGWVPWVDTNNPVAVWNMEGTNASQTLEVINSLHAAFKPTVGTGPIIQIIGTNQNGRLERGALFNGSTTYFQVNDSSLLSFTNGACTWMAWVRRHRYDAKDYVISKYLGPQEEWNLGFSDSGDGRVISCLWDDAEVKYRIEWCEDDTLWVTNEWHHLAVTYDNASTNFVFYIDGVVETGVTSDHQAGFISMRDGSSPVTLGAYYANGNEFDGLLDDFRAYSNALPADVILDIKNNTQLPNGNIELR